MKPGTIVVVTWEDSATETNSLEWQPAKKLRDALKKNAGAVPCHSTGFVVHDGKRCLTLSGNISESGQVSHVIHIPRSAIRKVKRLQKP